MSSKFFTWTKGERKQAAEVLRRSGVIPIPVECISIRGLDVRKTPRLESASNRSSADSNVKYSPHSTALHDAAVESATSLLAVVNDLLNSPHVSAHLSHRASTLQLPNGRPRSRTAPSTPRGGLPQLGPVELPGSFPTVVSNDKPMRDQPMESYFVPIPSTNSERPHASPQAGSFVAPRPSFEDTARTINQEPSHTISSNSSHEGSVSSPSASFITAPSKPLLPALERPSFNQDITQHSSNVETSVQQDDAEAVLLQQISSMRNTHDTHIRSLKQAHDNEVTSHLAYISFLERRQLERATQLAQSTQRKGLTINTVQITQSPSELPASDVSATTLQSFESGFSGDKSVARETIAEVESLRRKLSLVHKVQAESADLSRQKDQMRDSLEQRDRRILQLKQVARRAKDSERTLRNTVADLDARLTEANNQRLDVLEGFHVACSTLQIVSKRRSPRELAVCLSKTLPSETVQSNTVKTSHPRSVKGSPDHQRPSSAQTSNVWDSDPLVAKVKHLQVLLRKKDEQITKLEKELQNKVTTESHNAGRFEELQNNITLGEDALHKSEHDRERYHSLLRSELRRQARQASGRTPIISPSIAAEASSKMQELLLGAKTTLRSSTGSSTDKEDLKSIPGILEKELEHCLGEIIMYKLDVRGYRKDLRAARDELESLRASADERPPTPPEPHPAPGGQQCEVSSHGGLGISLPCPPVTPPRTVGAATAEGLLVASADCSSIMSSPLHRPKTPLGTCKKLPKPPSSLSPSPLLPTCRSPPILRISRAETMRSMSDSIISSYTQRATPEMTSTAMDYEVNQVLSADDHLRHSAVCTPLLA